MNNKEVFGWFASSVSWVSSLMTLEMGEQMIAIIVGIMGVISAMLSIAYSIYKWYKRATWDGGDGGKNITVKEIGELLDEVKENGNFDK